MPDTTPSMPPLPEPVEWQYRIHFGGLRGWSSWYTEDKADIDAHPDRHLPAIFEVRGLYTAEQVQAVADARVREAMAEVAAKLRRAGADLPAPPVQGTIPSALLTGLSIALALVDDWKPDATRSLAGKEGTT